MEKTSKVLAYVAIVAYVAAIFAFVMANSLGSDSIWSIEKDTMFGAAWTSAICFCLANVCGTASVVLCLPLQEVRCWNTLSTIGIAMMVQSFLLGIVILCMCIFRSLPANLEQTMTYPTVGMFAVSLLFLTLYSFVYSFVALTEKEYMRGLRKFAAALMMLSMIIMALLQGEIISECFWLDFTGFVFFALGVIGLIIGCLIPYIKERIEVHRTQER